MIEDRISALTSAIEKLTATIQATFAPRIGAESSTPAGAAIGGCTGSLAKSEEPTGAVLGAGAATAVSEKTAPATEATTTAEPAKRTRRTKEQIAADNAAKAATAPAGNEPAATHAAGINEIRDMAQKVLDAGGFEKMREVYKSHGAKDLGSLSPDKYVSVISALEALLAAPAEDAAEETVAEEPAKATAPAVTLDDIAALGKQLVDKGLVGKVKEILVAFDVPKLSPSAKDPNVKIAKLGNTPPDKFAAVHAALAKALADSSEEV